MARESEFSKTRKTFRPSAYKSSSNYYAAVHMWIKKHKPMSDECEECGRIEKLQYANLSFEYRKDIKDWKCLCIICHSILDSNSVLGKRMKMCDISVIEFILKYPAVGEEKHKTQKGKHNLHRNWIIILQYIVDRFTYKKIAQQHNISIERVRQIIREIILFLSRTTKKYVSVRVGMTL